MSLIKLEEKATDQETFDFIVGKLREQGRPSYGSANHPGTDEPYGQDFCLYAGPDGCKCAVGFLVPEGQALPEGVGNITRLAHSLDCTPYVEVPRNLALLERLQLAHDTTARVNRSRHEAWAKDCAVSCVDVAEQFGLNPASAEAWADSLPR